MNSKKKKLAIFAIPLLLMAIILVWIQSSGENIYSSKYGSPARPEIIQAMLTYDLEKVKALVPDKISPDHVLETGVYKGSRIIYWASFFSSRNTEILEYLLKLGADPDAEGSGGLTTLYIISDLLLFPALKEANLSTIKVADLLIKHGANVNKRHPILGRTALHAAAKGCNYNLATLFMKNGADPNIKDLKGKTALDLAIEDYIIYRPSGEKITLNAQFPDQIEQRKKIIKLLKPVTNTAE